MIFSEFYARKFDSEFTMKGYIEINSFVSKFCQLWCNGDQADLHIRCINGQSFLNLNVGLGYAHQEGTTRSFDSHTTARSRRRARRARMKRNDCSNTEEETQKYKSENTCIKESAPCLEEEFISENMEEEIIAENINIIEKRNCDTFIQEELAPSTKFEEPVQQDADIEDSVDDSKLNGALVQNIEVDNETVEVKSYDHDIGETITHIEDKVEACIEESVVRTLPELIEVHATAIFDQSPTQYLAQEEFESLGRFITNLEHLQRNIKNVVVDSYSTSTLGDGKFKHTACIRIYVKSERLWESGRSYVWKHLGQDIWERGNGTCISLRKIHQKN